MRLPSNWQRNGSIKPTTIDPGRASRARELLDFIDADYIDAEVQGARGPDGLCHITLHKLPLIRSLSFSAQSRPAPSLQMFLDLLLEAPPSM